MKPESKTPSLARASERAGFVVLREEDHWRIYTDPEEILVASDAQSLRDLLVQVDSHAQRGGETAGFLAYEAGYVLEPRLLPLLGNQKMTLAWFGLYRHCQLARELELPQSRTQQPVENAGLEIGRERYCDKVEEIRTLIEAGEVYQINFTDRVTFGLRDSPWNLFTGLCHEHPTPYAAFLNTGSEQVVSLSPELFFRIEGGQIVVQPMKGTAPRGLTIEDDRRRMEELRQSEKERAENVMIVDLMRNDLGKICRAGSVMTKRLFEVERFPSVWQMTSTVEGQLCDRWTVGSVIRALFPSGSVTGAPKIRAIEHIARLETSARGIYTGAIGYFARGRSQFNVAIRTAVVRSARGVMGVGSGITYDSSPSAEWEECGWKCGFLTQRTPTFELFETLLWDDEYVLLDRHLARMSGSAEYFGFTLDRSAIQNKLNDAAARFPSSQKRRVRISLARDGQMIVEDAPIAETRYGRVRMAEHRVSSNDRFLFHKTTHRQFYDSELASARAAQCDDVLFFNERNQLTEGAIHNVFILKDGVWRTPPVQCGLLAGSYRGMFLAEHSEALEAVLRLEDLVEADAIFLCNSVRGMYQVELVQAEILTSSLVPGQ